MTTHSSGDLRVAWLPAVAHNTLAEVTMAEITAGTDLTDLIVSDGVSTPNNATTVDVSTIGTRQVKTAPGRYGGDPIEITFLRKTALADDEAWTTFTKDATGFLLIGRFQVDGKAFAAGDRVEVWPVTVMSRQSLNVATNDANKAMARLAVPNVPNDNAAVVA